MDQLQVCGTGKYPSLNNFHGNECQDECVIRKHVILVWAKLAARLEILPVRNTHAELQTQRTALVFFKYRNRLCSTAAMPYYDKKRGHVRQRKAEG